MAGFSRNSYFGQSPFLDLLERWLAKRALASTRDSKGTSAQFESDSAPFDPHLILEVSPGASYKQIRASYRKQIKRYHPDKVAYLGADFQDLTNKRMIGIQHACDTLLSLRT